MEASQLKINPDHLRFKVMTHGKRSALRRENIKALIRSKPAGTIITGLDFARVTQSTPESCNSMVRTMVKKGVLRKIPSETRRGHFCYEVVEDAKVVVPASKHSLKEIVAQLSIPAPTAILDLNPHAGLVEQAKQFVWEKDSDSLREFIKWLDSQEKAKNE